MDFSKRIEGGLDRALSFATASGKPPKLAEALRYAVFPGGARIRPRLCLAVAHACGNKNPEAAEAVACALEMLHCASLVHDDMPCFDDADTRRGKPTIHSIWDEPIALLAGDGLIILAFETIARECAATPHLIAPLIGTVSRASGMPHGIVAGQAWESEEEISITHYHRAKTAALFTGAAMAGAIASEADTQPWFALGDSLGAAYQVADDLRDLLASDEELGKEAGQDAKNGRPNAAAEMGTARCLEKLKSLVKQAMDAVPPCDGNEMLQKLILGEAQRLMPKKLAARAA